MACNINDAGIIPQKAMLIKITVSNPSPMSVEPIVRVHNQRPFVAIFNLASTNELVNSPTR